jgi:hypothetical protein
VARAKSTARAEARRRYRAEHGIEPDVQDIDDAATAGTGATTATGPRATATDQPQRMGMADAFRKSFRPLDLRGDLAALPQIAVTTKALWVPLLLTIGSTIAFAITAGQDVVTRFLYAYFIQTPAIGGVFIAGFLAPRASWLLGLIVGLVSAICYAVLLMTVLAPEVAATPGGGTMEQIILTALVLSPGMGIVFASAAAWYRRFLTLSSPNRGRQNPPGRRGPDGRSRGGTQKASARR